MTILEDGRFTRERHHRRTRYLAWTSNPVRRRQKWPWDRRETRPPTPRAEQRYLCASSSNSHGAQRRLRSCSVTRPDRTYTNRLHCDELPGQSSVESSLSADPQNSRTPNIAIAGNLQTNKTPCPNLHAARDVARQACHDEGHSAADGEHKGQRKHAQYDC